MTEKLSSESFLPSFTPSKVIYEFCRAPCTKYISNIYIPSCRKRPPSLYRRLVRCIVFTCSSFTLRFSSESNARVCTAKRFRSPQPARARQTPQISRFIFSQNEVFGLYLASVLFGPRARVYAREARMLLLTLQLFVCVAPQDCRYIDRAKSRLRSGFVPSSISVQPAWCLVNHGFLGKIGSENPDSVIDTGRAERRADI